MVKILVVDDETDVESLFKLKFRKEEKDGSVKVLFSDSGKGALDILNDGDGKEVIIVLSDINMPDMTGIDLLKAIKEKYPYKKVVMVTAYGNEEYQTEAFSNGADDFLTKPVDFNKLKETILSLRNESNND